MQLNIFCKKGTTAEGRYFPIYLSTIVKRDGTQTSVNVKFRESCGKPDPEDCPCTIEVDKENANLVTRPIIVEEDGVKVVLTNDDGEPKMRNTLWVSEWRMIGRYIDHSLDDYI